MKVSSDVYTKDLDAALEAYKLAIESGATDIQLNSYENHITNEFEYLNLTFKAEHTSPVISYLDDGPFVKDTDYL